MHPLQSYKGREIREEASSVPDIDAFHRDLTVSASGGRDRERMEGAALIPWILIREKNTAHTYLPEVCLAKE